MTVEPKPGVRHTLLHEYIELVNGQCVCRRCGVELCASTENYKLHVVRTDFPLSSLGERYVGVAGTLDEAIVFRVYDCPSCGRRLDAEVCPVSAVPLHDFEPVATPGASRLHMQSSTRMEVTD
jgi:acetone carboxylase gamma subunit